MINAIMAMDQAGGIGKTGTLPWPHIKRDFQWFTDHTLGHVVVMGANTWKDPDMPKPMPNRVNVVITNNPDSCLESNKVISGDIRQGILDLEKEYIGLKIWVIGGERIIHKVWDLLDNFYLTKVNGIYDCDRFLDFERIFGNNNFNLKFQEVYDNISYEIWTRNRE